MPKLSNRIDRTKLKSKTLIENEIKKISQIKKLFSTVYRVRKDKKLYNLYTTPNGLAINTGYVYRWYNLRNPFGLSKSTSSGILTSIEDVKGNEQLTFKRLAER